MLFAFEPVEGEKEVVTQRRKEGIYAECTETAENTEKKKQDGHGVPCPYQEKGQERKRTDSRWNIFMAMKRAAAA